MSDSGRDPGWQDPPAGLLPMLATTGPLPTDDAGWAYEMKWDGLRALAFIAGGSVRLASRSARNITHAYPELAAEPESLGTREAVLDGEIVAFGDHPWPDFETLQQRMNIGSAAQARRLATQIPVSYLAFDLLWLDGRSLLDQPYVRRRELLEGLDLPGSRWSVPPSFVGESGVDVQSASRAQHLEGVMAKRLQSRYEPGRRSTAWRKIKNTTRQEVVIGGWKPGEGNREGRIGSLLVGVYAGDDLVYCGHVGTGFTEQTLQMLGDKLAPLRRDSSPFAATIPREDARMARWVEPELVAEVRFANWTKSGHLRAPAYMGLRIDKEPREVVREP